MSAGFLQSVQNKYRMKSMFKERDYGIPTDNLGDLGTPELVDSKSTHIACPNCGCKDTFSVKIRVNNVNSKDPAVNLLRGVTSGGVIFGNYVGCPACPWASPMMMTAVETEPHPPEDLVEAAIKAKPTADEETAKLMEDVERALNNASITFEAKLRETFSEELASLESLSLDSEEDRDALVDLLARKFLDRLPRNFGGLVP